jgi:uncharacterized protein
MVVAVVATAPVVDHHQHLLSADMTAPGQQAIDADALIAMLDAAGIKRAVLLSNGFRYGQDFPKLQAENDWTAREAAKYPKRLTALCSVDPLDEHALEEIRRCAQGKQFGRGIKLQFGMSDVNLDDPHHIELLQAVFRTANANQMALVVHMRTRRARAYGAAQAQVFLDKLLAESPDVVVQIAHFTGGGNPNDTAADQALGVFIDAIKRHESRVRKLYFDLALVAPPGTSPERREWLAQRIREIGVGHVLYGSDGGDPTDPPPKVQVQAFHELPLTTAEFSAIEKNVAPYLR